MPSLHIGWSTWCALVLVATAPYLWVRILGALYPMATFVVVLGTANHWLLDAAGGLVTLGIAYLLHYALTGQRLGERQVPITRRAAAAFTGDAVSLAVSGRGGGPTSQAPVVDAAPDEPVRTALGTSPASDEDRPRCPNSQPGIGPFAP
jgi:PAP2 superfamily